MFLVFDEINAPALLNLMLNAQKLYGKYSLEALKFVKLNNLKTFEVVLQFYFS